MCSVRVLCLSMVSDHTDVYHAWSQLTMPEPGVVGLCVNHTQARHVAINQTNCTLGVKHAHAWYGSCECEYTFRARKLVGNLWFSQMIQSLSLTSTLFIPGGQGRVHPLAQWAGCGGEETESSGAGERGAASQAPGPGGGQAGSAGRAGEEPWGRTWARFMPVYLEQFSVFTTEISSKLNSSSCMVWGLYRVNVNLMIFTEHDHCYSGYALMLLCHWNTAPLTWTLICKTFCKWLPLVGETVKPGAKHTIFCLN